MFSKKTFLLSFLFFITILSSTSFAAKGGTDPKSPVPNDLIPIIKQSIWEVIPKETDGKNLSKRPTIATLHEAKNADLGLTLFIGLRFNIVQDSGDFTGRDMLNNIRDIYGLLYKNPKLKKYKAIAIGGSIPMADKYNNVKETQVLQSVLGRNIGEKINWNDLTRAKFIDIMLDDGILNIHEAIVPKR